MSAVERTNLDWSGTVGGRTSSWVSRNVRRIKVSSIIIWVIVHSISINHMHIGRFKGVEDENTE